MNQEVDDATLLVPFELDHLSLHGHILPLDNCIYAWIDTNNHLSLHSISLSTTIKSSTSTTPVLCNNDACNALSKALSAKLRMPVLMGMGQGIERLVSDHIPEIITTIFTTHNNFIRPNK